MVVEINLHVHTGSSQHTLGHTAHRYHARTHIHTTPTASTQTFATHNKMKNKKMKNKNKKEKVKNNINPKILIVDNKPNMIVSLETVDRVNVSKNPSKNAK